jgi:hypothetical protein
MKIQRDSTNLMMDTWEGWRAKPAKKGFVFENIRE